MVLKFQYIQYFCYFLLNFSYIFNKITPGFLWDIAETPGKVKTRYGLMTLTSIWAYSEGNGICGAYNIQKTAIYNFLPIFCYFWYI